MVSHRDVTLDRAGGSERSPPTVLLHDDEDDDMEDGTGRPLVDSLMDAFDNFNGYDHMAMMDEEDLDDLEAIRLIFFQNKRKRGTKFMHSRCDWESHIHMLIATNEFEIIVSRISNGDDKSYVHAINIQYQ